MTRISAQFGLIAHPFRILTCMIFFAVASLPALAQQKVSIGVTGALSELPLYIAEQNGYFAEEGIAPEFVKIMSGTQMIVPLSTGDLNVAAGSVSAALFNAAARGISIKIVAGGSVAKPGYGSLQLMVRKDLIQSGRVKTIADLRGMKVASSAKGGQGDVALQRAFQKVGMAFSDVDAVYLGRTDLVVALQNGAIDAALVTEPDATISEETGGSVRFMTGDQLYPNEQVSVLIYSPEFIAKLRETGTKFMRAYLRAARVYNDALVDGKIAGPGAADLIALVAQVAEIKDLAVLKRMRAFGLDPNGEVNVEGLRNDLELYREWGLIQGDPTVDQSIDQSFAQAARASLPTYGNGSGFGTIVK